MQNGATLPELQALLGHASLAMTMRCAYLAPEHLWAVVSRLDDVLALQSAASSRSVPAG